MTDGMAIGQSRDLTQLVKNATQKTKKCTNFNYFIF
jgi:hypothetical protein